MAETIILKGVATVRWGVDSIAVITNFIPQTVSVSREPGINKRVKDEKGFVISKIFGDDHYKATIKAVYKGGTPPATGDFLSVSTDAAGTATANANYVCEKCTWDYSNENELLLNIEAEATSQITAT